jgi:transposase
MKAHRRHDISDKVWQYWSLICRGVRGTGGGVARDNRQFINAVFWIIRTGVPRGEICHLTMGVGAIHTVVLFVGGTKGYGKGNMTGTYISTDM